jgi:outer membrane murein-binding lipoprotein Lpp
MKHIQKLICVLSVFLSAFLMSGCAEQSKKARIGIIGALDEEVAALKDALTDKKPQSLAVWNTAKGSSR